MTRTLVLAALLGSPAVAADTLTLDNGAALTGALSAYKAGGVCTIDVEAGPLAGTQVLLGCDRIARFERSGPMAEEPSLAGLSAAPDPSALDAAPPATGASPLEAASPVTGAAAAKAVADAPAPQPTSAAAVAQAAPPAEPAPLVAEAVAPARRVAMPPQPSMVVLRDAATPPRPLLEEVEPPGAAR